MMKSIYLIATLLALSFALSCQTGSNKTDKDIPNDSVKTNQSDSTANADTLPKDSITADNGSTQKKADQSKVLIYNFHVTNRCVSCIAIEDATTKTLKTYFNNELKSGRIKRQILNVDDDANKTIAEKYQAFGSGVFVTKVYKGKETTTDLTGDGFKFAKNKEDKFIEILKNKISEYLK